MFIHCEQLVDIVSGRTAAKITELLPPATADPLVMGGVGGFSSQPGYDLIG